MYDSIQRGKQTWQNLKDFEGQFGHDENLFDTLGEELEPYQAKSLETLTPEEIAKEDHFIFKNYL